MNHDDQAIESVLTRYRPSGPPAQLGEQIFRLREKKPHRMWPAIAAAILLVAGAGLLWRQVVRPNVSVNDQEKLAQIEISVSQAGKAEQLLAVANILAGQPGAEDHAKGIYYEVINHYPNFKSQALGQLNHKFPSERRAE
ncbi:MAG TPA: hypothetical protein VMX13_02480 [Sedimentisphaerales bacterium]|nr:hypothetical protein [Sedimentisphaerales bacterium]